MSYLAFFLLVLSLQNLVCILYHSTAEFGPQPNGWCSTHGRWLLHWPHRVSRSGVVRVESDLLCPRPSPESLNQPSPIKPLNRPAQQLIGNSGKRENLGDFVIHGFYGAKKKKKKEFPGVSQIHVHLHGTDLAGQQVTVYHLLSLWYGLFIHYILQIIHYF